MAKKTITYDALELLEVELLVELEELAELQNNISRRTQKMSSPYLELLELGTSTTRVFWYTFKLSMSQ